MWKNQKLFSGFLIRALHFYLVLLPTNSWASQMALVVKNPPTNGRYIRDVRLIPGSGRSPGEGMTTHSSILTWKISWMEDSGMLQSIGSQRVGHNWVTSLFHLVLAYDIMSLIQTQFSDFKFTKKLTLESKQSFSRNLYFKIWCLTKPKMILYNAPFRKYVLFIK